MAKFISWLNQVPLLAWLAVGLAAIAAVVGKFVDQAKFVKEQRAVRKRQGQVLRAALRGDKNEAKVEALLEKHAKHKAELEKARVRVENRDNLAAEINKYLAGGLVLLLALMPAMVRAEPCVQAFAIEQEQPAACTGLLVPSSYALEAHNCLTVDLPLARSETETVRAVCVLEKEDLIMKNAELQALALEPVVVTEPTTDWITVGLVGGGALVVGALLSGVLVWQVSD